MNKITLISIIIWFFSVMPAQALNIAVFPFDDLSKGGNSINLFLADYVGNYLNHKGLTVTVGETVFSFMAQKRIRYLGYLESKDIVSTREAMGTELILLGSVCQDQGENANLGVTLSLIRTIDARTIWANSESIALNDIQPILGIASPRIYEDLLPILVDRLLKDWPVDLDFTAGKKLVDTTIASVTELSQVEIDSVFFTPKFVRPGQEVKCTIRFRSKPEVTNTPRFYLKINNHVYLASTKDGIQYEARWVIDENIDTRRFQTVQLASTDFYTPLFEEILSSQILDADYPVNLIIDWPSGKREETFLGSYVVDSKPPEVALVVGGEILNGIHSFSNSLPIFIRWLRSEPIDRWNVFIKNKSGGLVWSNEGTGMPPNKLIWRGQNARNRKVADGMYDIEFSVLDRAGNEGFSSEKVSFIGDAPEITVEIKKIDNQVVVNLSVDHLVPIRSWYFEMWSKKNQLLKKINGAELPASFSVILPEEKIKLAETEAVLIIKDVLGNSATKKYDNLLLLSSKTGNANENGPDVNGWKTQNSESVWHEDF